MRAIRDEISNSTSFAAATSCRESPRSVDTDNRGNILPQSEWFGRMARDVWQFKAAAHVQCHTGYSDRTCRSWTSADSEPPARVLALLLRTTDGPRILAWIMRGGELPEWYATLQRVYAALGNVLACE